MSARERTEAAAHFKWYVLLHCTPVTFVARRHVPRLAIKSSLGRAPSIPAVARDLRSRSGGRLLGPGGGPRCGGERKVEAASEKIASGCYILRDRDGARPARAAARYLIWLLSEPRVAVFWPGIVLRGFTFISILITRSLGSRFGTRYPSSTYTHTLLFLLLLLLAPSCRRRRCFSLVSSFPLLFLVVVVVVVFLLVRRFG